MRSDLLSNPDTWFFALSTLISNSFSLHFEYISNLGISSEEADQYLLNCFSDIFFCTWTTRIMKQQEDILIGKAAYRSFQKYLQKHHIQQEIESNPEALIGLGLVWLQAFGDGYDFRKKHSIIDNVSNN